MTVRSAATNLPSSDQQHMVHPVTPLRAGGPEPLIVTEGEGIYVRDASGRRYIDGMSSQWNVNIGHGRREILDAILAQGRRISFATTFFGQSNVPAIELADRLATLTPGSLHRLFFTAGGSESNEVAFKLARHYWAAQGQPEKVKVIALEGAYHGVSLGALSATGLPNYRRYHGPLAPGFLHIAAPFRYRCQLCQGELACTLRCAEELELAIEREGEDTVAAFIAEPIQGPGGVRVPPSGYFERIRETCNRRHVLFITDEVITGFGRTGTMFGIEHWGVTPDLMVFAKGISSGYLPLGGVAIADAVYDTIAAQPDAMIFDGHTSAGHPLCCAVGLANLQVLERENLVENARVVGEHLLDRLGEFLDRPYVAEVRGKGLLAALQLTADRNRRASFDPSLQIEHRLRLAARQRGLIIRPIGDLIALSPPLIITREQVDSMVEILAATIDSVMPSLVGA